MQLRKKLIDNSSPLEVNQYPGLLPASNAQWFHYIAFRNANSESIRLICMNRDDCDFFFHVTSLADGILDLLYYDAIPRGIASNYIMELNRAVVRILLVEPQYYTRYPPLGPLKLSTFHKQQGDEVLFIRGNRRIDFAPDRIYLTSLFTWDWRAVWKAVQFYKASFPRAELRLGGIYASLLPQHAKLSGADIVYEGIIPEIERLLPDYSLVPDWKVSILFATRGCPRKCGFCSVPKLEGPPVATQSSIHPLIHPGHSKIIFFDNNILGLPNANDIFQELAELNLEADFNQGMDVRYMNEENVSLLTRVRMPIIRLAFDYSGIRPWVEKGIQMLKEHGRSGRRVVFYTLYNYVDDPEDFFERIRDLLSWGVVAYPMRYEPLCTLDKGSYVAPGWSHQALDMVQAARRVIGYGGAFPPYEGLVKKFVNARNFHEAFSLRPQQKCQEIPEPIVEMALEHGHVDSLDGVARVAGE